MRFLYLFLYPREIFAYLRTFVTSIISNIVISPRQKKLLLDRVINYIKENILYIALARSIYLIAHNKTRPPSDKACLDCRFGCRLTTTYTHQPTLAPVPSGTLRFSGGRRHWCRRNSYALFSIKDGAFYTFYII